VLIGIVLFVGASLDGKNSAWLRSFLPSRHAGPTADRDDKHGIAAFLPASSYLTQAPRHRLSATGEMRILLASETYRPDLNGASRFAQCLAGALSARGHDVHVLCPAADRGVRVERDGRLTVHRIPSLSIPGYAAVRCCAAPATRPRIGATLREIAPDVVHVQNHFFIGRAAIGAARRLDIPVVATNHFVPENFLVYLPRLAMTLRGRVERLLWRDLARVYGGAATITAPSPVAAELLRAAGLVPVGVISNGVDLDTFHPGRSATAARRRYGISAAPTYMHVGRLDREKRVQDLIRALALVRQSIDAQLVIVGDGRMRPALERLASREGVQKHTIFTGPAPDADLPGLYAACDVFCAAGTAELQSIVTLEAMAAGRPVVAADALALPCLVRDGVNGYTFPPGDAAALADRLTRLLGDGRACAEMGRRGREAAVSHAHGRVVEAFERLYADVAARSSPGEALPQQTELLAAAPPHVAAAGARAVSEDVQGLAGQNVACADE